MYDGGRKVTADEIIEKENGCENFGRWQSALFDRLARRSRDGQDADKNYTVLVQQSVLASPSFRRSDLATTSERIL